MIKAIAKFVQLGSLARVVCRMFRMAMAAKQLEDAKCLPRIFYDEDNELIDRETQRNTKTGNEGEQ